MKSFCDNSEYFEKTRTYNSKINSFYLDYLNRKHPLSKSFFEFTEQNCSDFPLIKFDIGNIISKLREKLVQSKNLSKISYKLVDIKLVYSYLKTATPDPQRGLTLIVGNNEVNKLNPNTIALLQVNHYRVYLISILNEMIFDLFQLCYMNKSKDYKRDKLTKIYNSLKGKIDKFISLDEFEIICKFKDTFRTAEFHKFSKVRGFISKLQWDHFQEEEKIIDKIIERLSSEEIVL